MAQEQEQVLQEQRLMLMATMILMVLAEQFGPLLSPKFAYHTGCGVTSHFVTWPFSSFWLLSPTAAQHGSRAAGCRQAAGTFLTISLPISTGDH